MKRNFKKIKLPLFILITIPILLYDYQIGLYLAKKNNCENEILPAFSTYGIDMRGDIKLTLGVILWQIIVMYAFFATGIRLIKFIQNKRIGKSNIIFFV